MENVRLRTQSIECQTLSEYATLSQNSKGREKKEPECELRTVFQRDRDRIIHSKSFRRLKHKTQVFLAPETDHYRTRLTHTLEVAQIARTISRALRLNEDLTEAIALGHDLGHTPFGHAGERALNELMPDGFTHYEQSVRTCRLIEKDGKGLNLTYEVLDGIKNHTKGEFPKTQEGCVVRFSDRIAYINHDIDDAVRGGIISESDIPKALCDLLGNTKTERINTMVCSIVNNSTNEIKMDDATFAAFNELHSFLFEHVYSNRTAKAEEDKVQAFVCALFEHFCKNPQEMPKDYFGICEREGVMRAACDYVAGMTDRYALATYNKLFVPKYWDL